eukprot:scaffold13253_cov140-Isochrysis_galbana.AAC.7
MSTSCHSVPVGIEELPRRHSVAALRTRTGNERLRHLLACCFLLLREDCEGKEDQPHAMAKDGRFHRATRLPRRCRTDVFEGQLLQRLALLNAACHRLRKGHKLTAPPLVDRLPRMDRNARRPGLRLRGVGRTRGSCGLGNLEREIDERDPELAQLQLLRQQRPVGGIRLALVERCDERGQRQAETTPADGGRYKELECGHVASGEIHARANECHLEQVSRASQVQRLRLLCHYRQGCARALDQAPAQWNQPAD